MYASDSGGSSSSNSSNSNYSVNVEEKRKIFQNLFLQQEVKSAVVVHREVAGRAHARVTTTLDGREETKRKTSL